MGFLLSWSKHVTPLRSLLAFCLVAMGFSILVVRLREPDLLLLLLVIPVLLMAHFARQRYYVAAVFIATLSALWVISSTSNDLPRSLAILTLVLVSVVSIGEATYRLSRVQRHRLGNLYTSDRWFRSIFADSPIAIELFHGDGRLLDINRAGLDLFGVASVEDVKNFQLFDDPNVTDAIKERLRRGETVHYTNRFDFAPIKAANLYETTRDGIIELDVLITPLGVQDGKAPEGYLVQAQDITEQLRQQRALAESEAKLRAIFNASDDGIVLTDENGLIIEFSQGMERITGWSRTEMLGLPVWEMEYRLLPEGQKDERSLDMIRDMAEQALRTGTANTIPYAIEKQVLHRNGELKAVELQIFSTATNHGFQLGSICHDISERYRVAAALRESEERYRVLAEMSSDSFAILRVAEDGSFHRVWITGDSFERLCGYNMDELGVADIHKLVLPEDRVVVKLDLAPGLGTVRQEFRITTADGRIRWMRQRYHCKHDEAGRPTVLYLAVEDVTDLKEVEQQAMAFRLEKEQTRLLTNFIQTASHEFRTPLSVINLDLHFLQRTATDEPQRRRLTRVAEQVKTLSSLVDALLTLSSLDSEAPIELTAVDLSVIVADVVGQHQPAAQAKGLTFTADLEPALPPVWGAPHYLSKAVDSLLDNAIRYTPTGGQVAIRAYSVDGVVRVAISDTGIGIAPEIHTDIFERFYRLDEAHSTQGFGLGLPIALKVAQRHGGHVFVQSETGQGSVFVLELPGGEESSKSS